MKFTWMIKAKREKIEIGENSTPKRTIVIEEVSDNEYKTSIAIDFIGNEKVALLDSVSGGDVATVFYNIRANENDWKDYNQINGWKIENMTNKKTEAEEKEAVFGED